MWLVQWNEEPDGVSMNEMIVALARENGSKFAKS